MRLHALLLSTIFTAGISVSALAQDNQPQPAPDPSPAPPVTEPQAQQTQTQAPPQAQPADSSQPTPAPDLQDQAGSPQVKHDGSKKDVGAIGSRKVGGLDWYSPETDVKIGKAYAQQVERTMKMVDDPVINEYVNRIGQNLVRSSDAKFPFTIKVVDDDEINAMSLPGGFLYVNSGLILAAEDEAELAGAMAHEVAHVALRHATRQMTRANIFQMLTIPVVIATGIPINPSLVMPVAFLKFSRGFEAEADYFGLQYMYKAGYDPAALVTFFEKLQALEKRKPNALSRAFATHPQNADRVKKSQKEIAEILPARDNYVETTSEFNDVKARLAVLEHRRKMDDSNRNKPVLRRIASHVSESDGNREDDDRPVR
jgi:beta-barrel assembly-enhancing protease